MNEATSLCFGIHLINTTQKKNEFRDTGKKLHRPLIHVYVKQNENKKKRKKIKTAALVKNVHLHVREVQSDVNIRITSCQTCKMIELVR